MLGYHFHEDENGNTFKCVDLNCDVVKKRMEKYSQLAHKVGQILYTVMKKVRFQLLQYFEL